MTALQTSVPGKIMIAGEYSVLKGSPALAVTVDKRLVATASLSEDDFILSSNLWETSRHFQDLDLSSQDLFHQTCAWAQKTWSLSPFSLRVSSDIEVSHGIGSSSALRLACLCSLQGLHKDLSAPPLELAKIAWNLQRKQQSFASGYDFATQLTGGLVKFSSQDSDWAIEKLCLKHLQKLVHVYVGGRGAPTDQVGGSTLSWLQEKELIKDLMSISNSLIEALIAFNESGTELRELISLVSQHRRLFSQNEHFPRHIVNSLSRLAEFDKTWTFKTTGAGGEDAILVFHKGSPGTIINQTLANHGWYPAPFRFDETGLNQTGVKQN